MDSRHDEVFDEAAALKLVDGDRELLQELAASFLEVYPQFMQDIRTALEAGDGPGLQRAAHSLKGSVQTFVAGPAAAVARELEALGERGELERAAATSRLVEEEMERLRQALVALGGGDASDPGLRPQP